MKYLYKFYVNYLFYSGIFWGFITFTYDLSSNKFVPSKRLNVWNRVMTLITFSSLITTIYYIMIYLLKAKFYSFQEICFMCVNTSTLLIFLCILVITSNINEKFIEFASSSRKLFDSIGLSNKGQTEIIKSFTFTFVNDLAAYAIAFYLIVRTIKSNNESEIYLVILNYFVWKGLKNLTSLHIFAMIFATQLTKKINDDIDNLLSSMENKRKMTSKQAMVNFECIAILYEELITFAKSVHEQARFIVLITVVFNTQELVSGVSFICYFGIHIYMIYIFRYFSLSKSL